MDIPRWVSSVSTRGQPSLHVQPARLRLKLCPVDPVDEAQTCHLPNSEVGRLPGARSGLRCTEPILGPDIVSTVAHAQGTFCPRPARSRRILPAVAQT